MSERLSIPTDLFLAYASEHGGAEEAREAMRDVLREEAPDG